MEVLIKIRDNYMPDARVGSPVMMWIETCARGVRGHALPDFFL